MSKSKRKRTGLQRVTVFGMTHAEVARFSTAVEKLAQVARDLQTLFDRFDLTTCTLEAAAEVLDRRYLNRERSRRKREAAAQPETVDAQGEGSINGQ